MFSFPPETRANKSWQVAALAVMSMVAIAPQAEAASMVMYTGNTTGGPTWNRTLSGNPPNVLSSVGTAVRFSVQEFSVDTNGLYDFSSIGQYDNYFFLYQTAFDPNSPFTNVIFGVDPFPTIGNGSFNNVPLTLGTPYFLVTSGFDNDDFGTFTNTITGPEGSNITLAGQPTPVPVPPAALGLLLTSALSARKLRQQCTVGVQPTAKV